MKPANPIAYDQPSSAPTPKVAAAGISGSITAILIYAAKELFSLEIPAEIGAAIATVIAFLSAYIIRDRKPIPVVEEIINSDIDIK